MHGVASAATWLRGRRDVRGVELTGFDDSEASFDAAIDQVVEALATHRGGRFLLGGEGETCEVVAHVAARLLSGDAPVFGLAGVVLVAPTSTVESAGVLDLPALVVDGGSSVADVFPRARFAPLPEHSDETGALLDAFLAREIETAPLVPRDWARLIASDRTDVEVRSILARRALPDDVEYVPRVMDAGQLGLLRQIADLLVPQDGVGTDGASIDLAARVDAQLARGAGDGWRNASLPPDPEAYRAGLVTLAGCWPGGDAEETLRAAIGGDLQTEGPFDSAQMTAWLEDVRVDVLRHWLAHPAVMAVAGFDAFATGGTVLPLRGFTELGAGRRDSWEPASVVSE